MKRITDDAMRVAVGRTLAEIRASRHLRQDAAGEQSTVAKIEGGANFPSWPTLLEMCRRYGVSTAEVLTAAEESIGGKPGRKLAALDPEQDELLKLYDSLNAEGRRVLLERARACAKLFRK